MKVKFYLLLLCIFLASCSSQKEITLPSDTLLADCVINEPPVLTGSDAKDKVILAQAWSNQTSALSVCQKKVRLMQVWKRIQMDRMGVK